MPAMKFQFNSKLGLIKASNVLVKERKKALQVPNLTDTRKIKTL